jgi:transcriptional antiterminator RfaH
MPCCMQPNSSCVDIPGFSEGDTAPAWYCIRTHPKHEHIAAAHLRHIPELEVFNPQLRIERLTRRGPVRSTEPLFVNYIFVRCTLQNIERVKFTASVKTVVHFGDRVATIPDAVIEELRTTLAEHADTLFTDTPAAGDEAAISNGPFQGEKGVVTRVLPARQRVELLLEVMGRPLPTEFSLSSIIFKRRPGAHRLFGVCNAGSSQRCA